MEHGRRTFTARVVHGAGRGKRLGTPTLNLDLPDIPSTLGDGVYACWVDGDAEQETQNRGVRRQAVMHVGTRPTFGDERSCEVHVLDETIDEAPERIQVEVIARLRDVKTFASPEELQRQIREDIDTARAKLTMNPTSPRLRGASN